MDAKDVARIVYNFPDKLAEYFRTLKNPVHGTIPFSLKERPYLVEIYREFGPDVSNKTILLYCSRKVEKTETITNLLLYGLTVFDGVVEVYTAGKQEQVTRFVKERLMDAVKLSRFGFFNQLFDGGSPTMLRFKCKLPDVYNILYAYTSWSEANALLGIAGDVVCIDETQDIQPGFYEKIREIVKRSPIKWVIVSGTARDVDDEFDRLWKMTDQREWVVTCHSCGREQILGDENLFYETNKDDNGKYSEDAIINTAYIGCRYCGAKIKRNEGKWVPQKEGRNIHGYHMTQLMVPDIPASEIMDCKIHYTTRKYYNEVLGIPFEGKSRPLSISTILKVCDTYTMWDAAPENEYTFAGIDWGAEDTIVIIDKNCRVVYAGKIKTNSADDEVDEVLRLMDKFNVKLLVADFGYGARQIKELQTKRGKQVRSMMYVNSVKDPIRYEEWDKDGNFIWRYYVDKTTHIDSVLDAFYKPELHNLKIPYYHGYTDLEWMIDELHNLKAETRDDGAKSERMRYGRYGDDHAFHALGYALFAMWQSAEDDIKISKLV